MIASFIAAAWLAQAGLVWTLYEEGGSVTLAHEAPDTAVLKSTLECRAGTGVARVSVYGVAAAPGFVTFRAGQASAAAEGGPAPGAPDALAASLRTDHPVFSAFVASGALAIVSGARTLEIDVADADLAKLRRFAQLCGG